MTIQSFEHVLAQAQQLSSNQQAQLISILAHQLASFQPLSRDKSAILQAIRQHIAADPMNKRTASEIANTIRKERENWDNEA